jgi:hypothetical protein
MLLLAFVGGFIAAKKLEICIPESSNSIKSAGVMPWCRAISNNSTRAHSTTSGLGSAGCRILFKVTFHKRHAFLRSKTLHPKNRLLLSVQNRTFSGRFGGDGATQYDKDHKKGRLSTSVTFRPAHSLLYATADAEPGLGSA